MVYTPQVRKALEKAIQIHHNQVRKGTPIPYITHPIEVALILADVQASENVVIAGILHDTVEDSDGIYTLEQIENDFGKQVTLLVKDVTEESKQVPWLERKLKAEQDILHMSHDSLLVKAADTLHNLADLAYRQKTEGDTFWTSFNAPKEDKIQHEQRKATLLKQAWSENPLLNDIEDRLNELLKFAYPKNE